MSIFTLLATACHAQEFPVGETTLFDESVTLCYSEPFKPYSKMSETYFVELDEAPTPNLSQMNDILAGYKRILTPAPKAKWSDFKTGADLRWKRLCRQELPESAIAYYRTGRWMIDSDYDDAEAQDYPRHPLSDQYLIKNRYWYEDETLVHVEILLRPKK